MEYHNSPSVFWLHTSWRRRLRLKSTILHIPDFRYIDVGLGHIGYSIPSCITRRHQHTKFSSNRKKFLWMDVQYGRADIVTGFC